MRALGFGGLGDAFIIALKIQENNNHIEYTHITDDSNLVEGIGTILEYYNIQADIHTTTDIKRTWHLLEKDYEYKYNVFAKGHIDIPKKAYHWEPCTDEGFHSAFSTQLSKLDQVCVQVSAGEAHRSSRSYLTTPLVPYVMREFDGIPVNWIGTDKDFSMDFGNNLCGKTSLLDVMKLIRISKYFIGYPSFLMYWALHNRCECKIFPDHQGDTDLRVHDLWKDYLEYTRG